MERTAPEAHASTIVAVGLETRFLEDPRRDGHRSLGPRRGDAKSFPLGATDLQARVLCDSARGLLAGLVPLPRPDRTEQHRAHEVVPSLRDGHVDLAVRGFVVLRRASGAAPA